ncbi:hypothetical protein GM415_13165 [Pseudodesulfovibrio cashew]|uniref:Uncharacterized protein n=1 Tax=Pseudodesulfovibrio cashew TaxID=2678688 RepID=A0A6I6JDX9_9BACT|nr:hypothetical protein [Pseudodesulfovibrio cashew]QGY41035.1 hypothetical protein GM415_13165 [Pseudodesulfovibrio cashew]
MNRNITAAILVVCALLLAVGAYFLVSKSPDSGQGELRREVSPPGETAQPPAWVGHEQNATPNYDSAEMEARNATKPVAEPAPAIQPEKQTKVIEIKEDKVVTLTFVEALADFMLQRFVPQDMTGKPATLASAKALNVYFGRELSGFNVRIDDIRAARRSVLDYAFTPEAISMLYKLYAPAFLAHLKDTAATDERVYSVRDGKERRTLEPAEIAAMLRLNAVRIDRAACVFTAIADNPDITQLAGRYLQAARAVERANGRLQDAMADGKATGEASTRLKQAIQQREHIRQEIISTLGARCPGGQPSELFYLAQWSYRRVLDDPDAKLAAFQSAATVLTDFAEQCREAAKGLEQ